LACHGVITFPELQEDFEIKDLPELKDLYIDTGLEPEKLKKLGIDIGSYVIARHHFKTLGNKDIISGKALDDRVGCYVLLQVAKNLKKMEQDIYYVFTVQEEIGLYGAQVSTYHLEPDWGLAIDTINAEDSGEFVTEGVRIGKGPCILLKDAEIITNKCLDDWIRLAAQKEGIKIQMKVEEIGTTDATKILLSKSGIPATVICVPVRNIHSTVGISHMKDIEDSIRLIIAILNRPPRICAI
ncbi:MAG: M28 family peptidase, partial [Candidatus Nanoarchaeia archaeon]